MKTTKNTALITGGASGIGYEIARLLSASGNKVIICGRNEEKLKQAAAGLKNTTYIRCDITNEQDVQQLVNKVNAEYPDLNLLVNNAGKAFSYTLGGASSAFARAQEEILTNYLSTVRLTEQLLPILQSQTEAAIVNVSSVVAFTPGTILPTYSASKAALHSYTQTLRLTLGQTNVKVFEVMPPLVDTDFSKAIPGQKIPADEVAAALLEGLRKDNFEVRIGATELIYKLYLQSPEKALLAMNTIR